MHRTFFTSSNNATFVEIILIRVCGWELYAIHVCARDQCADMWHILGVAVTLTHSSSGKAGMSVFRNIRRDAENASECVHLHLANFLRSRRCAIKMCQCKRSIIFHVIKCLELRFYRKIFTALLCQCWIFGHNRSRYPSCQICMPWYLAVEYHAFEWKKH